MPCVSIRCPLTCSCAEILPPWRLMLPPLRAAVHAGARAGAHAAHHAVALALRQPRRTSEAVDFARTGCVRRGLRCFQLGRAPRCCGGAGAYQGVDPP